MRRAIGWHRGRPAADRFESARVNFAAQRQRSRFGDAFAGTARIMRRELIVAVAQPTGRDAATSPPEARSWKR